MSKKKKSKEEKDIKQWRKMYKTLASNGNDKSKKDLNKKFKSVLKEIENERMRMYELDKRAKKGNHRKINKEEGNFYYNIKALQYRKKISDKWEKTGFLDHVLDLLKEVIPVVQLLAKMIGALIVSFLSLDGIKKIINPETLKKIAKIFDVVMAA